MKQVLKETVKLWVGIILILASISIIIAVVPYLFFTYAGIGNWQLIVCILWLLFWLSFVVTVGMRK